MTSTPTPDLARLMSLLPPNARSLVEVEGRDGGALARHYKQIYPASFYVRIDADAARAADCDIAHTADVETADATLFARCAMADGWIFERSLERLRDPARVLSQIRSQIAPDACVVACIANGAHWSLAAPGALTRIGALKLFQQTGFRLAGGVALIAPPPDAAVLAAVRAAALGIGADPELAVQDALPSHYLFKAMPA